MNFQFIFLTIHDLSSFPKEWKDYKPRTYVEINTIVNIDKLNAECFISQPSIYEILLSLFSELVEITANQSYTPCQIQHLLLQETN